MTSLYMGVLTNNAVPADEKVVRNTAEPVNPDKPAAEQTQAPEQGLVLTDTDPNLGMVGRQLASEWTEGTRVDPRPWQQAIDGVNQSTEIINNQVSSSGTAASREMAGQVHKTLSYAVGIEPVQDLRSNGKFGEQYFKRHDRAIQEGMGDYMQTPPGYLNPTMAATGKEQTREAVVASVYNTFYDNVMTGR